MRCCLEHRGRRNESSVANAVWTRGEGGDSRSELVAGEGQEGARRGELASLLARRSTCSADRQTLTAIYIPRTSTKQVYGRTLIASVPSLGVHTRPVPLRGLVR